jgi:hypothetical protein
MMWGRKRKREEEMNMGKEINNVRISDRHK